MKKTILVVFCFFFAMSYIQEQEARADASCLISKIWFGSPENGWKYGVEVENNSHPYQDIWVCVEHIVHYGEGSPCDHCTILGKYTMGECEIIEEDPVEFSVTSVPELTYNCHQYEVNVYVCVLDKEWICTEYLICEDFLDCADIY